VNVIAGNAQSQLNSYLRGVCPHLHFCLLMPIIKGDHCKRERHTEQTYARRV